MKRNILIFVVFFFMLTNIGSASGSSPEFQSNTWSSTIVIFNSEIHEIEYTVQFFGQQDGTGYIYGPESLQSYASKTMLVGNTFQDNDIAGSAVVVSDFPLGVIYRSSETVTKNPVFYTSLALAHAGYTFYIPDVVQNPDHKTLIGVQNAANYPISLILSFYRMDGSIVEISPGVSIDPNRSLVFDTSDPIYSELGCDFAGSLAVRADGIMIVAAQQIQVNGSGTFSYEGLASGAAAAFAPNVMCQFGPRLISSIIQAQNITENASSIFVDYYDQNGTFLGTQDSGTVAPFSSYSFSACDLVENQGLSMTAVVYGPSVAAVVKSTDGSGTMSAAYLAQSIREKHAGPHLKYRVMVPFIQWSRSASGYQTFISVMNVSDQASSNITIDYYQQNGELGSSVTLAGAGNSLAAYGKRETDPNAAPGLITRNNSEYVGSAVVLSDQPISVVVRVQRDTFSPSGEIVTFGEDYSGVLDNVVWTP
jgi:hypothetical protein